MVPDGHDQQADLVVGSFLQNLTGTERDDLLAAGARRRYPARASLFLEGEPAHEVLIVLAGEVKALVTARDGREVILAVLGEGALLGEISVLDGGDRSATVQALGPVDVLAIRNDRFGDFLGEYPVVVGKLARMVAAGLRDAGRRQLEFGTGDSTGRLCVRLLELAERYGEPDGDGVIRLESPLSQAELASWSGLSREAVVKSMRALRTMAWIRNAGRSITILRPDELRLRAEA